MDKYCPWCDTKLPAESAQPAAAQPVALDTTRMLASAREHGMDLDDNPVAYEFFNKDTGHAVVDYTRWTHAGHLTQKDGYEARPLVYAAPVAAQPTLPDFIRRRIEQAIRETTHPSHGGMHLGDGKVRALASDLAYMLKLINAMTSKTGANEC